MGKSGERHARIGYATVRVLLSTAIAGLSGVVAYLLRFDFQIPVVWMPGAVAAMSCWVLLQPPVLFVSGWNRIGWNGIALPDLRFLLRSIAVASSLSTAAILLLRLGQVPRSVFVLQAVVMAILSIAARVAVRLILERRDRGESNIPLKRALIYGAGSAGQALLRELHRKRQIGYEPVGFVDDDENLRSQIVQGMPVLGNGVALTRLVVQHRVDEILIAMPSLPPRRLAEIASCCDQAGRPCKTIPSVEELIRSPERLTELRRINLEDLLGREPVQLDLGSISRRLAGRAVLVTGAAGSIGSEICRQVAAFSPVLLVALDIAETPLFELENEFREHFPLCPIMPTIGDIRDETQMYRLMRDCDIEIVFHAAAYKHVPMMERHVASAIANNVLGTLAVVNAAERARIRDFVMISTDKAVRPTSVMGATKRVAEMIVKSRSGGVTKFVSVRFGNVLGSNGSVVPIFQRQILSGGPITITHPEMRRYFMTIPEAAQLVMQAMALGTSDEIFVLDMGSPVLIGDLARSLIALHGKVPGRDIALEYTGLRPGEKLFEELYLSDENLVRSVHQKILVLQGGRIDRGWLDGQIAALRSSLQDTPTSLRNVLRQIVPEYSSGGKARSAPEQKSESTGDSLRALQSALTAKHLAKRDGIDAMEVA